MLTMHRSDAPGPSPLLRHNSQSSLRRTDAPQSPRDTERRSSRLSGFFGLNNKDKEPPVISGPTGPMVHKIHVDLNWQWEGEDPARVFRLERRLGEGAYGVVHKAIQEGTNFPLAIKVVNMTGTLSVCAVYVCGCRRSLAYAERSTKQVTEAMDEVNLLKKLTHSNIVKCVGRPGCPSLVSKCHACRYFGCCLKDKSLWVLMEWCAYGSVRDVMKKLKVRLKLLFPDLRVAVPDPCR